jgi:hypothetical protein
MIEGVQNFKLRMSVVVVAFTVIAMCSSFDNICVVPALLVFPWMFACGTL